MCSRVWIYMPAPAVCDALCMTDVRLGVRALVAGGVWRADVPDVDDAASPPRRRCVLCGGEVVRG